MKIRPATKIDKTHIQTLMDELNAYRKNNFSPENQAFHERTQPYKPLEDADFQNNIFFVATNDADDVVGFIQGTIDERKNHRLDKLGYLDELYIRDEYRGQGLAEKLFAELEKEFVARDCNHLITRTDVENESAQQFYKKVGMSRVTVELWKKI